MRHVILIRIYLLIGSLVVGAMATLQGQGHIGSYNIGPFIGSSMGFGIIPFIINIFIFEKLRSIDKQKKLKWFYSKVLLFSILVFVFVWYANSHK